MGKRSYQNSNLKNDSKYETDYNAESFKKLLGQFLGILQWSGENSKNNDNKDSEKKKIEDLNNLKDILERTNIFYHEEISRLQAENSALLSKNVELEKAKNALENQLNSEKTNADYYKNRCQELEKQTKKTSTKEIDKRALISFLFSEVTNKEELNARHKQIQRLFHPDNFRNGEELFKIAQNYYECLRYKYK